MFSPDGAVFVPEDDCEDAPDDWLKILLIACSTLSSPFLIASSSSNVKSLRPEILYCSRADSTSFLEVSICSCMSSPEYLSPSATAVMFSLCQKARAMAAIIIISSIIKTVLSPLWDFLICELIVILLSYMPKTCLLKASVLSKISLPSFFVIISAALPRH